jgi:hypothetical protein
MKAIPTCIAFAAMAGTVLAQAEQRRSDCEAHRARDGGALAVGPGCRHRSILVFWFIRPWRRRREFLAPQKAPFKPR